jgi:PleD family two-component response regulator
LDDFDARMQTVSQASGSDTKPSSATAHDTFRHAQPRVFALVVDSSLDNALATANLLTESDFHVTVADNFARAKERLAECPPALLVTELRLREYNGLQLVLRGKARRSNLAAIVLSAESDPVLEADAEAMGATFIVRPITAKQFIAAALRTLFKAQSDDLADTIRPPFERRLKQTRVKQQPTAFDRRRAERRRDHSSLMAFAAGVS